MTLSTTSPIENYTYQGPGDYDYDFVAYDDDHITVMYTDTDGVQSTLVKDSDFTVTLNYDYAGGRITMVTPTAVTGTLSIRRVVPLEQQTDYVNNDAFDMAVLERDLDTIVMMIQQINTTVAEGLVTVEWRGDWATLEYYDIRDIVTGPDSNLYICNIAHTAGTFTTDLAAGYWIKVVDVEAATDAAAAALVSEANASTSEDNAANCASASYVSAGEASNSAAQALAYRNAAEAARDQALEVATTRNNYTLATSGSISLDPDNGTHQVTDTTGTVTFTDGFDDEQWMILQIRGNGNTINWPTMTWMGGSPPSLHATAWNRLEIWKHGSWLYGVIY